MLKSLNKLFLRRENVQNTQGSYNQVNAKEKYFTAIQNMDDIELATVIEI